MSDMVTYYPDYDVMDQAEEWDSHTKEIVKKRLGPFPRFRVLNTKEVDRLTAIAKHITYDDREEIIAWVVHHIDEKLDSPIGEGQRKKNTPMQRQLISDGLKALDHVAKLTHAKEFLGLDEKDQFEILAALQLGQCAQIPEWGRLPQKDLFKKLATLITEAYYSHPVVWSEIGYGGPVYPRSYVRIEFGLTDPWEAKRHGK